MHPDFHAAETTRLSDAQNLALTILFFRLKYCAGEGVVVGEGVFVIDQVRRLFADHVEAAPLTVYYKISADDRKVLIIDVQPLESDALQISPNTLIETLIES